MNVVDLDRLFKDIDLKLYPTLKEIVLLLSEIKKGMETNNIMLSTPIGENRYLGEPLIDIVDKLDNLMVNYRDIKESWQPNIS